MKTLSILFNRTFFILILVFIIDLYGNAFNQIKMAIHLQDAAVVYEEFQDIYSTCSKLDEDLGNIMLVPRKDRMFKQISKDERVFNLKSELNRLVEEYNAKSNMWGRYLWKSRRLPYELDVINYPNYNN